MLDIDKGPVILEANARPAFAIQIANRIGLAARLQFVESRVQSATPLDARIAMIDLLNEIK